MENMEDKIKKELKDCSDKFYATIEQIKQLNEQAKAYQITYSYLKKLLADSESDQNNVDNNLTSNDSDNSTNNESNKNDKSPDTPDYLK